MIDYLLVPFTDYAFMQRALLVCLMLCCGAAPLGLFMHLRRLTLVGDAMSHAILPGVAAAFLFGGAGIGAMTAGGLLAGVAVALAALGLVRFTQLKEDASFSLLSLMSLSGGVLLLSGHDRNVDLLHILFGNILAIDNGALSLIFGVSVVTVLALGLFHRSFVIECFDPSFLKVQGRRGFIGPLFLLLMVTNLVAAFQALGTLMALGLIMLPAMSARFWCRTLPRMLPLAALFGGIAAYLGLLLSYHHQLPAGPAVVMVMGGLALASALLGINGSLYRHFRA